MHELCHENLLRLVIASRYRRKCVFFVKCQRQYSWNGVDVLRHCLKKMSRYRVSHHVICRLKFPAFELRTIVRALNFLIKAYPPFSSCALSIILRSGGGSRSAQQGRFFRACPASYGFSSLKRGTMKRRQQQQQQQEDNSALYFYLSALYFVYSIYAHD